MQPCAVLVSMRRWPRIHESRSAIRSQRGTTTPGQRSAMRSSHPSRFAAPAASGKSWSAHDQLGKRAGTAQRVGCDTGAHPATPQWSLGQCAGGASALATIGQFPSFKSARQDVHTAAAAAAAFHVAIVLRTEQMTSSGNEDKFSTEHVRSADLFAQAARKDADMILPRQGALCGHGRGRRRNALCLFVDSLYAKLRKARLFVTPTRHVSLSGLTPQPRRFW